MPRGEKILSIVAPFPGEKVWPNANRGHWGPKAKQTRQYRGLIANLARAAMKGQAPMLQSGIVHLTFYYPDERYMHDEDNCKGAFKAGQDGLKDAGIFVDDRYVKLEVDRIVIPNTPRNIDIVVYTEAP